MWRTFQHLCLVSILLAMTACQRETVLKYKDVQSLSVVELSGEGQQKIRISGLAFMSAMSVRRIATRSNGSSVTVLVFIGPVREGQSGSFSYDLIVPPTDRDVRFSEDQVVIWRRSANL